MTATNPPPDDRLVAHVAAPVAMARAIPAPLRAKLRVAIAGLSALPLDAMDATVDFMIEMEDRCGVRDSSPESPAG